MKPLKVIIVDDNLVFRVALKKLLMAEFHAEIIGEASNAKEYRSIKDLPMANIIFMDVMMPNIDGITLAKETIWQNPRQRIIAITLHIDKVYLETLIGVGFKGCINKNNIFSELRSAIDAVKAGKLYFDKSITITK